MGEAENPKETKQDLIAGAKSLPPTEIFSLKPRTFDEAFRFANLIAESTLIPKEFQKAPANVLIAVQLGMELGVSPMQALQNIAVVNGRPTIWGDLLPAIVYASGLMEQFDEQGDEKQASCTVKRRGFAAITRTFSMEEAKKVLYWEWKENVRKEMTLADKQTYRSYPKRMLQMRARTYAMRDAFPDVLKGVAVHEDVDDIPAEARDVTPTPEPIKIPQALPVQTKGIVDESKPADSSTRPSEAGSASPASDRQPARTGPEKTTGKRKGAELASVPTEGQGGAAEKSQEDIIAECLLWVENCTDEELRAENNWVMQQLKNVKGTENQLKVLRPFNTRKQAAMLGAKP